MKKEMLSEVFKKNQKIWGEGREIGDRGKHRVVSPKRKGELILHVNMKKKKGLLILRLRKFTKFEIKSLNFIKLKKMLESQ